MKLKFFNSGAEEATLRTVLQLDIWSPTRERSRSGGLPHLSFFSFSQCTVGLLPSVFLVRDLLFGTTFRTKMATNLDEEQSLRECEQYVARHNIQQILKDCIVQLCVVRPDNPTSFLREYFQKLERVSTQMVYSLPIFSHIILIFSFNILSHVFLLS